MKTSPPLRLWTCLGSVALAFCFPSAHAVILYSTGNPADNTTAPTGPLLDSGWQYANAFGTFNAYPISSDSFVVAKHLVGGIHQNGVGGANFTYLGVTYLSTGRVDEPNGGDLTVLRIDPTAPQGPFPSFVPLYRKSDEFGKDFVVLGRGFERGAEVHIPATAVTAASPNGTFRGWEWGGNAGTQRWGENRVDLILNSTGPGYDQEFLFSTLTPPGAGGLPNEASLAGGDSGGGVFIKDTADGIWKLAGINTGVDTVFSLTPGGSAIAMALIDAGGLYDGSNQLQDTTGLDLAFGLSPDFLSYELTHDPALLSHLAGNYHTRISNLVPWLDAVTVPETTPTPAVFAGALLAGVWLISRRAGRAAV